MNISLRALQSLVPGLSGTPEEIAERLRAGDVSVSRIVPLRDMLEPIVVGRVEAVSQHPNADRLRICSVNDGGEAPLQIITGADNVREGACYPLVRSGTTLPNGTKIKRGKLRGEVSEGMLGSPDELELGAGHDGLMTLSPDLEPGARLVDVLEVEGTVFVLEGNPEEEALIAALRSDPAA